MLVIDLIFLYFLAAFNRNVTPLLKQNWQEHARMFLKEYLPDYYKQLQASEINEFFGNELEREIIKGKASGILSMASKHPRGLFLINKLQSLLSSGIDPGEVVAFLARVNEKRGGVVIGFNKNVLQGKVLGFDDDSEIIHDSHEIAVQATNGTIDLSSNPIVAIEALGEYEDTVLEELKIN